MTSFIDGPAKGQILSLRRAPIVLRVVRSSRGNFDALDQLGDTAAAHETIFVYRLVEKPMQVHLFIRGKGKAGGGWYAIGKYELLPDQPGDEHTRENAAWNKWCDANKDRLTPEWARGITE